MYGTSWCPTVAEIRALLDERGIPYHYFDIDEDKTARKTVYRLQCGGRRVPTLTLPDGTLIIEPAPHDLTALLDTREEPNQKQNGTP